MHVHTYKHTDKSRVRALRVLRERERENRVLRARERSKRERSQREGESGGTWTLGISRGPTEREKCERKGHSAHV